MLGTAGDVHSFLGSGLALAVRRHYVRVAANEHYSALVERTRLEFTLLCTAAHFRRILAHPHVWHPQRGIRLNGRFVEEALQDTLALLQQHAVLGTTGGAMPALLVHA